MFPSVTSLPASFDYFLSTTPCLTSWIGPSSRVECWKGSQTVEVLLSLELEGLGQSYTQIRSVYEICWRRFHLSVPFDLKLVYTVGQQKRKAVAFPASLIRPELLKKSRIVASTDLVSSAGEGYTLHFTCI